MLEGLKKCSSNYFEQCTSVKLNNAVTKITEVHDPDYERTINA